MSDPGLSRQRQPVLRQPVHAEGPARVVSPEIQELIRQLMRRARPAAGVGRPRSLATDPQEDKADDGIFASTAKTVSFGGKGQSGQSGSEQDAHGGHGGGSSAAPGAEVAFAAGALAPPYPEDGHMAVACAGLPERCAGHCERHGIQAMPTFLRETLAMLLPRFLHDLGDRLAVQLRAREKAAEQGEDEVEPLDIASPVWGACDELLDRMRPLYAVYHQESCLLPDVRETLCAVQDQLERAVQTHKAEGLLRKVLGDSVYVLLPVLLMACVPRPPQAPEHAGDAA